MRASCSRMNQGCCFYEHFPECVFVLNGLALPRASYFGMIVLSDLRHLHAMRMAESVLHTHVVVPIASIVAAHSGSLHQTVMLL